MNIKLLGTKILVKILPEEKKVGKIHIPDFTDINYNYIKVKVVGVGNGKRIKKTGLRRPVTDINLGDEGYIARFTGTRLVIEWERYAIIDEREIIGIIEVENEPNTQTTNTR